MTRPGGTNAGRVRMRCSRGASGCGRRFTLKKHPDKYKRQVRCPHCGSTWVLNIEAQRRAELKRQSTCHCYMYPFPHRAGSLRMCLAGADRGEPTDAEKEDYLRCLATPRSG